jgi:hypothetical protein
MRSTVKWNLRPDSSSHSCTPIQRALQLASKDADELERMMQCCSSPNSCDLIGHWYGINKGVGAAAIGIHQDVKVIERRCNRIVGHNILVEQVPVEVLACRGWQPKRNLIDNQPKTMGNFVVTHERDAKSCKEKLVLDYSLAENPRLDPSKHLIDELVEVSPGLLLGRARVRIGLVDVPVAYFVLTRLERGMCDGCDSASCDSLACDSLSF